MITVSSLYAAANAIKNRTPIYRMRVTTPVNSSPPTNITQEYATAPIKANYVDEILKDGPSLYLPLGETSGSTAFDSSGNGLNGSYIGSPPLNSYTGPIKGSSLNAPHFNGTTQYVTVPDNAILDANPDVFTLEAWVWMDSAPGSVYYVFDKGLNGYSLIIDSTPLVYLQKNGVGNIVVNSHVLSIGAWNHIVVTKNAAAFSIYINGIDDTNRVLYGNQTIAATAFELTIGAYRTGGDPLAGAIAQTAVYQGASLSPARIQAHYDCGQMLLNRAGVLPFMMLPTGFTSQVIPEKGQSSIGQTDVVLIDSSTYDSEVLADAPNLYLKLDEVNNSSTNAEDSSGQDGFNGVYVGSPQKAAIAGPIGTDVMDTAVALDGSTQYATVTNNGLLNPGDVLTLECWVYPNVSGAQYYIIDKGTNGYAFRIHSDRTIVFSKSDVADIVASIGVVPNFAWSHVVITKSGSSVHIYINGLDSTGSVSNQTIVAATGVLNLGRYYGGADYFPGSLARVAIYPTALSAARVLAHFNAAATRQNGTGNGAATRLIMGNIDGQMATFDMGFDTIREAEYAKGVFNGVVDNVVDGQTSYKITLRDPETLTNRQIFNVASSPLTVAMGSGDTSLTVADATGFQSSGYLKIDSEYLSYSSKTSTGNQPPDATFSSVVYGNGIWVAVAADGTVAISPDAKFWQNISVSEANWWTSVVWASGLGLFVVVARTGTHRVMTSPDGIIWTMRTASSAKSWNSVAWSPSLSLLAAVTNDGVVNAVMTSPDGITWTGRTTSENVQTTFIAWSSDLALFTTGTMTSTDGITWTKQVYNNLKAVAWSPSLSLFVAVGSTVNNSQIASSPDGVTWTMRVTTNNGNFRAVAWSPSLGLFMAVGYDGGGGFGTAAMSSTDGVSWTARTLVNFGSGGGAGGIAWSPSLSLFVLVGHGSSSCIQTSPDGITWTSRAASVNLDCVAWSPGLSLFFASGVNANTGKSSPDGITWTTRTLPSTDDWLSIAWSPGLTLFVIAANSRTSTNQVATSPDGITWTAHNTPTGIQWAGVCWSVDLSIFVAIGRPSAFGSLNGVMTSTDGVSWTQRTGTLPNATWDGVVWAPVLGAFVAVGGSFPMTSTNGTSWTGTAALFGTPSQIIWVHELTLFVAVTVTNALIMTSSDALNWTSRTPAEVNGWTGVAWSSTLSLLVIVGSGGTHKVQTSLNGITWTVRTAAVANAWQCVAFGNGLFAALANTGTGNREMISVDGVTWTTPVSTISGLTRGVTLAGVATSAASHSIAATVKETLYITGHPADIIKGTMENTDKTGLSISSTLVDEAWLAAYKTANPSYGMQHVITVASNAKAWLENQMYQVLGLYPVRRNGLISWHQVTGPEMSYDDTLTNDDIARDQNGNISLIFDENFRASVINYVQFYYDFDGSNYLTSSPVVQDATSIARYGNCPLLVYSQGLRSSVAGTQALIAAVQAVVIARYKNGTPKLTMNVLMNKNIIEPGDTFSVTLSIVPNPTTKSRGVTNAYMEVITRGVAYSQGNVAFGLVWTGWRG